MKWVEEGMVTKEGLVAYLASMCEQCSVGNLSVEGQAVQFPEGELELKIKYEEDEYGGKFSVKASWVNWEAEERDYDDEETEEE